ncbi:hypothetical protein V8C40DRAFT_43418 [Trichoderma camerunense]
MLNRVHAWLLSHIFYFIFHAQVEYYLLFYLRTYLFHMISTFIPCLLVVFYVTNHYPCLSLPLQPATPACHSSPNSKSNYAPFLFAA